jgi:hypothetical protein
MFRLSNIYFVVVTVLLSSQYLFPQELTNPDSDTLKIFVIAGQSNAINIHANSAGLEIALIDTTVRFYYHCGMPPDTNIPFFSTSNNKWTKLGIQRQVPYLAHSEYFFGPEITLVSGLTGSYENAAVIKCAYGGSNLAVDWNKNAVSGNMLYKTMMDQINNACSLLDSSGIKYAFSGFIWIQGESDASKQSYAQAYFVNLREFISGVRNDLNNPDLLFIISRLPSRQPYTYLNLVRSAQEKASIEITNTRCIDTDNLELDNDKVHFTAAGMKTLGYLAAEEIISSVSSNYELSNQPVIKNFNLLQNYPNPFNPATTIGFSISESAHVVIEIFNVLGKKVSMLENQRFPPGSYEIEFNAGGIPSGIYFYKITAGRFADIKKMQLLK